MELSDFYSFSSKLMSSTVQAHPITSNLSAEFVRFNFKNKLVKGDFKGLSFPIYFRQEYGSKLLDIIDTGMSSLCLISENLKTLLEKERFIGWKPFEAIVIDKNDEKVEGYYGLSITGKSGSIDYNKSEIVEKQLAPKAPITRFLKGLYIDMEKWDGSDFFTTEGSLSIYCTKRVVDVLKKHKITNVEFENILEIETIEYAIKK